MPYHLGQTGSPDRSAWEAEVRAEIRIMAPTGRVWEVLADVDGYDAWNPFIPRAEGRLAPGARLDLALVTSEGRRRHLQAEVTDVEPERRAAWHGSLSLPRLLDRSHVVEIERRAADQTKLVQRQRLSGLLVPWFKRSGLDDTRLGLQAMNRALKEHIEQDL